MELNCGFVRGNKWFRYRVGAIIIENGCVLFARNEMDDYYYSIGGGVHLGETAETAVKREVLEETGVAYEIDRLAYIHENFFDGTDSLAGLDCHEISFYFLMKPRGTQQLQSHSFTDKGVPEFMHWIPLAELHNYKAFPTFFKDKLYHLSNTVEHIVTNEKA